MHSYGESAPVPVIRLRAKGVRRQHRRRGLIPYLRLDSAPDATTAAQSPYVPAPKAVLLFLHALALVPELLLVTLAFGLALVRWALVRGHVDAGPDEPPRSTTQCKSPVLHLCR